jgi:nitrate reductase gamma subunit
VGEDAYHALSLVAGGTAGLAMTAGFLVLAYRRLRIGRVRATTSRSDLVMYPLLALALFTGMATTLFGSLVSEHDYRETVAPWFRGIFTFRPDTEAISEAPFVFQLHVTAVWLLYAVWPFSRLVHAWSVPLAYLRRSSILYRSRSPRAAVAHERTRLDR